MRKLALALVFVLTALLPRAALAACTTAQTVGDTSTQILAANDLAAGRWVFIIQNTGATDVYCAMGTSNAATTTNGFLLVANGGSWREDTAPQGYTGVLYRLPNSDISCITASSTTTVVACDY